MKRLLIVTALILLALAAVPEAHATLRIQSVSSGLFNFDGPTQVNYRGSNYAANYYTNANDRMFLGASTQGGSGFGLALQRPVNVQQHHFPNHNDNYRSIHYGDWQLGQAHLSMPRHQTNIHVGQLYGHYSVRGNINGYTGGPSYGAPNAFMRTHNIHYQTHPHTYSGFGYTRPTNAFIQSGRAYY